jgi:HK97 gp10 family phage protein
MSASLQLQGVNEIQRALKALEKKVASKITRQALRKGTKEIAKQVKADTPKGESGQLKKQVKVKAAKRSRNKIGVDVVTSSPDAFYGSFVELGTSKQPAQHYQKQALDKVADRAIEIMLRELKAGIEAATLNRA